MGLMSWKSWWVEILTLRPERPMYVLSPGQAKRHPGLAWRTILTLWKSKSTDNHYFFPFRASLHFITLTPGRRFACPGLCTSIGLSGRRVRVSTPQLLNSSTLKLLNSSTSQLLNSLNFLNFLVFILFFSRLALSLPSKLKKLYNICR